MTISRKVVAALAADAALDVKPRALEEARELVRGGKITVAVVLPPGFADRAGKSSFAAATNPRFNCSTTLRTRPKCNGTRHPDAARHGSGERARRWADPVRSSCVDDSLRDLQTIGDEAGGPKAALRRMLQGVGEWNQRADVRSPQRTGNGGGFSMPYTVKPGGGHGAQGREVQQHGALVCRDVRAVHPVHGDRRGNDGAECSGGPGCGSGCRPRRSRATP